ncbi:Pycsar system effector family protein [Spirosoma pulveris]
MTPKLVHQIEAHIVQSFRDNPRPDLTYHTLAHTRGVVQAAEQLVKHYKLDETEELVVLAAAWFHDVGYLSGPPEDHEERSATLAAEFLTELGVSLGIIEQVKGCIRATKLPQSPRNRLEEILCDADMFHLASDDYKDKQKLLRKEKENLTGTAISGSEWRQKNIALLETHVYFTKYARNHLEEGRAANLHRLKEKQAEKNGDDKPVKSTKAIVNPEPAASPASVATEPSPAADKKKSKDSKSDRGVETMFRTTSSNHLRLSEIADSKANIMISVNSIMVSILVSILPRRIEENPNLMIPTALFLTTSVLTIVFAILATRPNVTQGTFSHEDIQQKKGNLLFFGNFHRMSLGEYEWGIQELMQDSSYLYGTMTRDIYYLGLVLAKKYKLLRVAYTVFMFGFVTSILAFLSVFLFFSK